MEKDKMTVIVAPNGLDQRSLALRREIVHAMGKAGKGHVGGSMSLVEILRILYDEIMTYDPRKPMMAERDRLILSKGHGCVALYTLLADKGFFPKEQMQECFNKGCILGGHPERGKIPGVEASTGSLGHGLSIGVGLSIAAKIKKQQHRVFVILGDGELGEGSIWEAAMCAPKHRLDNLVVLVDYNKVQSFGPVKDIMDMEPLVAKWQAFGFHAMEIDGHDLNALRRSLKGVPWETGKPTAIICHTVKGKGIPFAENTADWHYRYLDAPTTAKMLEALGGAS